MDDRPSMAICAVESSNGPAGPMGHDPPRPFAWSVPSGPETRERAFSSAAWRGRSGQS